MSPAREKQKEKLEEIKERIINELEAAAETARPVGWVNFISILTLDQAVDLVDKVIEEEKEKLNE